MKSKPFLHFSTHAYKCTVFPYLQLRGWILRPCCADFIGILQRSIQMFVVNHGSLKEMFDLDTYWSSMTRKQSLPLVSSCQPRKLFYIDIARYFASTPTARLSSKVGQSPEEKREL